MLRNYLKIAWRHLLRSKTFSAINILGLSLGIAVALTLLLYIHNEQLFDAYHTKAGRIYRVGLTATFDGQSEKWANAPNAVGPTMKAELPGVEQTARLLHHNFGQTAFVRANNRKFTEKRLYWADSSLFAVFDIPFVQGNPATALDGPDKVVLSQSAATRYFGTTDPVGQPLFVDNKDTLLVTGVYQDFPATSTLDADLIGSFSSQRWANHLSWGNASFESYALLSPQTSAEQVEAQMAKMVSSHVPKADRFFTLWLQPLLDVHLQSADITNASTTRIGDRRQVTIMGVLALVVLLIAGINYVNLTTARAQIRFREVGIIKIAGATVRSLITRFYVETALMVVLSLLLALGLVAASLPLINQLAEKHLSFGTIFDSSVGVVLLLIAGLITGLAGAYPAFYLSASPPIQLLSTTFRSQSGAGLFRRSLVVVQFVASVVLMISAVIFYQQLQFIQHQKLGYEPEQVLSITTAGGRSRDQLSALMNDYRSLSNVQSVCRAQTYPGFGGSGRTLAKSPDDRNGTAITTNRVSPEFIGVLGLKLLAGKTLPINKDSKDTTVQVVLNRKAVAYLGYTPEQAIGKVAPTLFTEHSTEIVGVVDDFHFESLHKPIGAYAFHNALTEEQPYMLVNVQTGHLPATMQQLEHVFRKDLPESAFEYTFLDEFLNTLYRSEQRTAQTVLVFSVLAILVACLGLFGLAAFAAEQRTKEIGVRKVLGASVGSIIALLSKDVLKLVLIAVVIASPLAWWAMDKWLADFAYKINIEWWMFALAGGLAVGIALLTVSLQSVKAALMNPVKSLRSE